MQQNDSPADGCTQGLSGWEAAGRPESSQGDPEAVCLQLYREAYAAAGGGGPSHGQCGSFAGSGCASYPPGCAAAFFELSVICE